MNLTKINEVFTKPSHKYCLIVLCLGQDRNCPGILFYPPQCKSNQRFTIVPLIFKNKDSPSLPQGLGVFLLKY